MSHELLCENLQYVSLREKISDGRIKIALDIDLKFFTHTFETIISSIYIRQKEPNSKKNLRRCQGGNSSIYLLIFLEDIWI